MFHTLSSTKTKSQFASIILIACSWAFAIWFQGLGWSFPPSPPYNLAFWNSFFPHLLLRNWRFPQLATGCSTVCAGALYSIFQVPDWCVFHMDSGLNWYKTIFQVRLAGTVEAICRTLYQEAASWDHLGIFLNEFIVVWSTSDISNLHLLLYCHLLGHYICVLYVTFGLRIITGKCFMVVYVDWMLWPVQLWHILQKRPASWTRWPLSEPYVRLRPQSCWWLLGLWFSVGTACSQMGSWLLAAMVQTNKSL